MLLLSVPAMAQEEEGKIKAAVEDPATAYAKATASQGNAIPPHAFE